ncbi:MULTISPECIES: glycosyltransferase family 2 protein [Rhizobium]|uniref:Glycosyltransferase family 2 protein n=1 Tax=Rhizobium rhododendri TaxID=2506430 RepID=A0ABY8IMW1_9HYPH|nr:MULTISPECIES: glycosyltransferase family 2 protein [Rhizobium]MBZ5760306.1 glycosyltransferase [Rhizobium sp. VS19-DR96]MBZ5766850.1 glycosyltransferase [Rhizobium sp. VS19-DR129.2]MBZ5773157.1 glycosyltransferase [Rhizobium sp. VS19-DRK62.2]MBZ5784141.1 glycosyltransferase [Rhizobium sp. VS19-DR121]MBZ5802501.1 glycosyltransferase [Rhizobium sp. VS19-DR181]
MRFGEYPPQAASTAAVALSDIVGEILPADAALPVFFGRLQAEAVALERIGIGRPYVATAAAAALLNGTRIEQELLAGTLVREDAYYGAIARALRVPFTETIPGGSVIDIAGLDSQLLRPTTLRVNHPLRPPLTLIAPQIDRLEEVAVLLRRYPDLKHSLIVTTPGAIRAAVWQAGADRRVRKTVGDLFESQPGFSARVVFHGYQGFYAGVGLSLLAVGLVSDPNTQTILHVLLSFSYLTTLMLRGRAVVQRRRRRPRLAVDPCGPCPVYTVMIAVYGEAEIVPQLVATLKRLDWPVSRLDIKFVCEADDRETIAALRAQTLGPQFEIVEVPPMHPRTKPKALTYALNGARGAYVAVYDAEDRPHPQQLREAYAKFRSAPADVACLQAPLVIGNGGENWISAMFALEYSALFRALLPMLARYRMPLPLGGTSNHFRTDILRSSGAWDPFNVTEDADLGMRLYRLGYRSDVIDRQTIEDAPTGIAIWSRQRTRWFKGWLQTWLVLMRDPRGLQRQMGFKAFAIFQLLIGGMLLSSLGHPLIMLFLLRSLTAMLHVPTEAISSFDMTMFVIDFSNIFGSYAIFLLLGTAAMIAPEKKRIRWRWMTVPFYWMLVSIAAWRAVIELRTNPFHWHKTPHRPSTPAL